MKIFVPPRKTLILIVVAVSVIGALIYHDCRTAGLIVSLLGIGAYLALELRFLIAGIIHFRKAGSAARIRLAVGIVLGYVFVSALAGGTVSYFLLLLALGVDYIVADRKKAG